MLETAIEKGFGFIIYVFLGVTYRIFPEFASNWRERVGASGPLTLRFDTYNINFC